MNGVRVWREKGRERRVRVGLENRNNVGFERGENGSESGM